MKVNVKIEWWNIKKPDDDLPDADYQELLDNALNRISDMSAQGYTSGQLLSVKSQGWWEITNV